jgi:uncharacterized protein YecE (DUF72 family)
MKAVGSKKVGSFYGGTSGLQIPIPRAQYPAGYEGATRLTYLASLVNSIEINSSFYKLPQAATVEKWSKSVPDDFRFTFKLSKTVTHEKGLQYKAEDVAAFFKVINNAGPKKGCVLVQFPPSLKDDHVDALKDLITDVIANDPEREWKIAVEFRDMSWYSAYVTDWLEEQNVAVVIQDIPKSATRVRQENTDFIYLRFHGPEPRYRGSYTDAFLLKQKAEIVAWLKQGKDVYVYFNNTMGDAFNNLVTLRDFVLAAMDG